MREERSQSLAGRRVEGAGAALQGSEPHAHPALPVLFTAVDPQHQPL